MKNVGIQTSLELIAQHAWGGRLQPAVYRRARGLTDSLSTNAEKVMTVVNYVNGQVRETPLDADEAVVAVAALCLAADVPCRIVGARRGESWTCLLSYQDGDGWTTIDVLTNRAVLGELDEVLEVKMPEDDMDRNDRQQKVIDWVRATFGAATCTAEERALRLLEETVELMQAHGITREKVQSVVGYVFKKPVGVPAQEVGGIGVTLLAYCAVAGLSADAEEARELERVLTIDPVKFRARHNVKAAAGIATPVVE